MSEKFKGEVPPQERTEKEKNKIRERIKYLFLEKPKSNLERLKKEEEKKEEIYNPYSNPIKREEFWREIERERMIKKQYRENLENFIEGMSAFVEIMDTSWLDDKTLTVLEKSKQAFGLDISKIVGFLNDLRELKEEK